MLGLGGLLLILLRWLWKIAKVLGRAKKNVKKINQAGKLAKARKISKGTAGKVIAANLAELAVQAEALGLIVKKLKEEIDEFRKKGKNKEADELQEHLDKLEKELKELEKQAEDLKKEHGQEQPTTEPATGQ